MAGYNYNYFGFAALKENATPDFVEELKTVLDSKLKVMCSTVSFDITEGFLYFNLSSTETVYYDLMEATFDYFMDKLKGKGVQVVGYCQKYCATHNDVPFYDDVVYKDYSEISDYQYSQLKQLMVKSMTHSIAFDALQECQWRGYAENYEGDVLFNYLAAIFHLEEESCLFQEMYIEQFNKILALLIESIGDIDYTLALDESTIVNDLFVELWAKSSDKIIEYMQALYEEEDNLYNMYEELLQYYKGAGIEKIIDTIDNLSANELRELYKNTYDHV